MASKSSRLLLNVSLDSGAYWTTINCSSAVTRPKLARGLTPTNLNENVHYLRCLAQLRSKEKDIEKNIYLSQLKDADPNMFYKICLAHMKEITPLIYTPTVGDACLQFSQNYRRPEGLVRFSSRRYFTHVTDIKSSQFVSINDKGRIRDVIRNWPRIEDARISVVTDGEQCCRCPLTMS